jgi:hypothetical protein
LLALLAGYFSWRTLGFKGGALPLPPLVSLANLIFIGGLVFLIWKWQLKAAIFLLSIIVIWGFVVIAKDIWFGIKFIWDLILAIIHWLRYLFPQTAIGWGILLLVTGFIALIAGVMVNWSQHQAGMRVVKKEFSSLPEEVPPKT